MYERPPHPQPKASKQYMKLSCSLLTALTAHITQERTTVECFEEASYISRLLFFVTTCLIQQFTPLWYSLSTPNSFEKKIKTENIQLWEQGGFYWSQPLPFASADSLIQYLLLARFRLSRSRKTFHEPSYYLWNIMNNVNLRSQTSSSVASHPCIVWVYARLLLAEDDLEHSMGARTLIVRVRSACSPDIRSFLDQI